MTAGELRAELVGRTFDSGAATIAIDRSGVVTVDAKGDVDVGGGTYTDDGQYCRTWNVGDRGRLRCYRVYRDGEAFELHAVDRWNRGEAPAPAIGTPKAERQERLLTCTRSGARSIRKRLRNLNARHWA
jgi:hypothetical protein